MAGVEVKLRRRIEARSRVDIGISTFECCDGVLPNLRTYVETRTNLHALHVIIVPLDIFGLNWPMAYNQAGHSTAATGEPYSGLPYSISYITADVPPYQVLAQGCRTGIWGPHRQTP